LRILVVSDTHGDLDPVQQAIEQLGPVDMVLHAGDHYRDSEEIEYLLEIPVKAVAGNCDFPGDGPAEQLLEIEGYKVFLTHGHRYGVNRSIRLLLEKAKELGADVVIYGHTHIHQCILEENILILNPGSPVKPRGGNAPSLAVLELDGAKIKAEILQLDYFFP